MNAGVLSKNEKSLYEAMKAVPAGEWRSIGDVRQMCKDIPSSSLYYLLNSLVAGKFLASRLTGAFREWQWTGQEYEPGNAHYQSSPNKKKAKPAASASAPKVSKGKQKMKAKKPMEDVDEFVKKFNGKDGQKDEICLTWAQGGEPRVDFFSKEAAQKNYLELLADGKISKLKAWKPAKVNLETKVTLE